MTNILNALLEQAHRIKQTRGFSHDDSLPRLVIYPYDEAGRNVSNLIRYIWGIEADYLVDDTPKSDDVLSLEAFSRLYRPGKMLILFTAGRNGFIQPLMRHMFVSGINARDVIMTDKSNFLASKAVEWLLNKPQYRTILDVGCGAGLQGRFFQDYGRQVTGITMSDEAGYAGECLDHVVKCDFFAYQGAPCNAVWLSHVLEHIPLPVEFLKKAADLVTPEGCLAITVPHMEQDILAGHIHTFSAGRLLRYMLCAGLDCREAEISASGYNLSIILPHVRRIPGNLGMNGAETMNDMYGDNQRIFSYLPKEIPIKKSWDGVYYFNGYITELNWEQGSIRI